MHQANIHPNGFMVLTDIYKDHLVSAAAIAVSLFGASYLIAQMGGF